MDHRITNTHFLHSFAQNVNTEDTWGPYQYKFITNSLGFKDKSNRKITKKNNIKRIIFIGDSFTEGIGYEYEDTFVGLIEEKFKQINTEVLNAGVASQSPTIYYLKIKFLIEELKITFDELIIFLDISDVPDEIYYQDYYNNLFLENNYLIKIEKKIGIFLTKNFSSILFYNVISEQLNHIKKNLILRYKASKEFKKSFFNIKKAEVSYYKSITVERGNWTHEEDLWKIHGQKGRKIAEQNLKKLLNLCINNNIKMSLVIYPLPSQIHYNLNPLNHRVYWNDWAVSNNINFYDFFNYFDSNNKKHLIKKFFIDGDIHWNTNGHKYISSIFIKEYQKKNNYIIID